MIQNKLTRQELLSKAKELYSQAKYAPPMNLFLIEAAIDSKDTTDDQLETICKLLDEHNKKQEEIYREYKEEMKQALSEYLTAISKKKNPKTG